MAATSDASKRFFVEVMAPTKEAIRRLHEFGLDLFRTTVRRDTEGSFRIEGLITLDEVGRLVEAGYPVLVAEESSARAGARDVSDLAAWLASRGA